MKVFVGGLPRNADDGDLEAAMSHFGHIEEAKVVLDRETGESRCFGFVTFADEDDAQAAIEEGEVEVLGRTAAIEEATT